MWTDKRCLAPIARLVSYGIAAVVFGLGPVSAVKEALERDGCEGFVDLGTLDGANVPAIAIVVAREPGLPEEIVNVEGGAIAHGHPIGATGAALTTKLIHSMRRDGLTRGLVTLCLGGGQGHRAGHRSATLNP
jgi:acetyl-CoA C-acetyltransferase